MSKITDMLISAIIKKGILYEARNCDIEVLVPYSNEENPDGKIKIQFKTDHMTLRVEKE